MKPETRNQKPETCGTYKWLVVVMLWFVCFFNYADRQAIFSVFELLKSEMNLSDVQLGIVGAWFMWVYAAIGPIAGLVGDRVNRKALIIAGLVFWSLITIATALSTKYSHLVLFRALEGFGEAFYFPASMSLISEYHGARNAFARDVYSSIKRVRGDNRRRKRCRCTWATVWMAFELLPFRLAGNSARPDAASIAA